VVKRDVGMSKQDPVATADSGRWLKEMSL
jgi:hypothetical protein